MVASCVENTRGPGPIPEQSRCRIEDISQTEKAEAFATLAAEAAACRRCPRMRGRRAVLGPGNGSINARVVFVGEAPGGRGADRSRIPFWGDQSGRRFDQLLEAASLQRDQLFVTNAVLCNPRDGQGRNAAPTLRELRNCSPFLRRSLALIDPIHIVTLGAQALRSLALLGAPPARLPEVVGRPRRWEKLVLHGLYHPGQRAQVHRPWEQQLQDADRLGRRIG